MLSVLPNAVLFALLIDCRRNPWDAFVARATRWCPIVGVQRWISLAHLQKPRGRERAARLYIDICTHTRARTLAEHAEQPGGQQCLRLALLSPGLFIYSAHCAKSNDVILDFRIIWPTIIRATWKR